MSTKTPAKRKKLKLPKSLGACADLLHDTREERLSIKKDMEVIQAEETEIKDHLIQRLDKGEEGGAVGKRYKAIAKNDTIYRVEDWDKFYAHIKKTGEFDLLNRMLNQAAVKERVEMQTPPTAPKARAKWKPKLPPGIGTMTVVKLSVTKV